MRWKSKISYMALCTIALMSCDKEESGSNQNSINDVFSDENYSVYMAFVYDSIPSASSKNITCSGIWTNAKSSAESPSIHKLSPGRDEGVEVFDICVTENKTVYAAGCFGNAAVYWENDKEVELPEGRVAMGIGVDPKGIVYTCGFQKEGYEESAKMWIGTNPKVLKNGTRAQKLNLCNGKCYIAGYGNNEVNEVEEARIWIDGQAYNKLSQDNDDKNQRGDYAAFANDIVSDGDNWWCVGRERNSGVGYLPKVWINRSNNNLKREGPSSSLTCIKYENGKFYIGGNDGYHAMYWTATQKSSKENRINDCKEFDLSSGSTQAVVEDIDVLNGIVVCCGYERSATGSNIPKLWINGSEYSLGEQLNNYSNVRPCAVAIVKR
ncbi:MAG: hypothetical protein U0K71_10935 [Paludibacteraceae bacterium]|nr:hypothetical protein [Paludibacteraceae bacterium]